MIGNMQRGAPGQLLEKGSPFAGAVRAVQIQGRLAFAGAAHVKRAAVELQNLFVH
jgi:hypothetical protein